MNPPLHSTLFLLFFTSGFAGLVYEVLWLRELGLLFGNTAYAASTTLAVFFLGQSVGQSWSGRQAGSLSNPLRAYALVELGIASASATYFFLLPLYRWLYPSLFAQLSESPVAFAAVKCLLSIGVLFPPAFFMGATLPIVGQHLVRRWQHLAPTISWLYGSNTLGGAVGALAAGFFLPPAIGFRNTYSVAIGLSAGVAAIAYWLSLTNASEPGRRVDAVEPKERRTDVTGPVGARWVITPIAFVSGFLTLALEVLWTRMFAQVLHNSVYSFATILVTFLIALGLGSFVAYRLSRTSYVPIQVLFVLLFVSGILIAASPFLFNYLTDGVAYFGPGQGWESYVTSMFGCAAAVMLFPGIVVGSVFPYLLKLSERSESTPGAVVGRLSAFNMVGAVVGSLAAGFLLLPYVGLWASIRTIAIAYLLVASLVGFVSKQLSMPARLSPIACIAAIVWILAPTRLPLVDLGPGRGTVREVWQSASGTVAVIENGPVLQMKLDNNYSVGANASITNDRRQGELPLLIHPGSRSVFYLGMGTGITAGAALFQPVERVTTCELVPEVVDAARKYFEPYANGLFRDPRSRIIIADGRNYLSASRERFDVIISDLFVPWHSGTGSLYSLEHFATVRASLNPGGLFALWLPLYQLSQDELSSIARTMLEAFPLVTLWRGDFLADAPVVALIGHDSPTTLDLSAVVANVRARAGGAGYPEETAKVMMLLFYAGNVTEARELFESAPINTDDRPEIEYAAPIAQRAVYGGTGAWLTGIRLVRFYSQLSAVAPPEEDPFLAHLNATETGYVRAGQHLYKAAVERLMGEQSAKSEYGAFSLLVPDDVEEKARYLLGR